MGGGEDNLKELFVFKGKVESFTAVLSNISYLLSCMLNKVKGIGQLL